MRFVRSGQEPIVVNLDIPAIDPPEEVRGLIRPIRAECPWRS
jgi:hypothetical protein